MDDALFAAISRLQLDDPRVQLPFSVRLARENGWSVGFAARVVAEYRRFVFLAVRAGHLVTPSDAVDQAWHLHLTYSRSYYGSLCEKVLGRVLHHGPTDGGRAESDKFHEAYEQTLASYREAFGVEPPADIWPPSAVRFDVTARFERIDRARHWVIPKPRAPRWARVKLPAACAAMATGGLGVTAAAADEPSAVSFASQAAVSEPVVVWVLAVVSVLALVWAWRAARGVKRDDDDRAVDLERLDAVGAAMLVGGRKRAVDTALVGLVDLGALELVPNQRGVSVRRLDVPLDASATPLDHALCAASFEGGAKGALLPQIRRSAREALVPVERRLEALGLRDVWSDRFHRRQLPVLLMLARFAHQIGSAVCSEGGSARRATEAG